MKTLVVYYSRTGATRRVAEVLKTRLGADIDEITEPKGRGGPLGWLQSGKEASKGIVVPINPMKLDPSGYEIVVIGTPIWSWNVSSPVRSYIVAVKEKLPRIAFFCCMDGQSGETFHVMAGLAGKEPLSTAEFLSGDVKNDVFKEQVGAFAQKIKVSSQASSIHP